MNKRRTAWPSFANTVSSSTLPSYHPQYLLLVDARHRPSHQLATQSLDRR